MLQLRLLFKSKEIIFFVTFT